MKPTKNESLFNHQCQRYVLFPTLKNGFQMLIISDSA